MKYIKMKEIKKPIATIPTMMVWSGITRRPFCFASFMPRITSFLDVSISISHMYNYLLSILSQNRGGDNWEMWNWDWEMGKIRAGEGMAPSGKL